MKKKITCALALTFASLPFAHSALITGVTATADSEFGSGFAATTLVNGADDPVNVTNNPASGVTAYDEGDTGDNSGNPAANFHFDARTHWLAAGVFDANVTLDLGGSYDLSELRILNTRNSGWNDSETDLFSVSVSSDGTNYTPVGAQTALQPFESGFQSFSLSNTGVTHVRLNVINDLALGTNTGAADVRVGLNEIQVFDTVVIPEPTSGLLLGLASAFLLRRKRRS
jgi:hypothetical protein